MINPHKSFGGARRWLTLVVSFTMLIMLNACINVGPDYAPPDTPVADSFELTAESEFTANSPGSAVWKSFNDEDLIALIEQGLAHNNDIALAVARLDESRAILGLSPYSLFPTVTASASSERSGQSGKDPFAFEGLGTSEVHRLQFDSSWEIDLFGTLRRQNQQITAVTESDTATLHDVQRTVTGDIAQSFFTLRGAQAQLQVQQQNLHNQSRAVEILTGALRAGRGTALDVARAQSLEMSLAAILPATEATIRRTLQRLSVLTAQPALELKESLGEGKLPALPKQIDVGTPQQWLSRRPDVRAAERHIAAASAAIGVEVAEFYPKLFLLGSFGYSGMAISDIGDNSAQLWNLGPTLQWRFLDFGRVRQDVRAAQARERQAVATFQNVLLHALEDMESALATYRSTNQTAQAIERALAFSTRASELVQLRFDNGASNYLELLDAERTRLDLANQHAQAVTAQATAIAAVYKALAVN